MAYGFPEKTVIPCPFCGYPIQVLWISEARRPRKASWGGQVSWRKTRSEEYLVQNDCPSCKKTKYELQKKLDETQSEINRKVLSIEKHSFALSRKN